MGNPLTVASVVHGLAQKERGLYRRFHVVIVALALGGILSLIGTGLCLQVRDEGAAALRSPALVIPLATVLLLALGIGLLRWLLNRPVYLLSDTSVSMVWSFPISLFRAPVTLHRENITRGILRYRPLDPELILGDDDGGVIGFSLWNRHLPGILDWCEGLPLPDALLEELRVLREVWLDEDAYSSASVSRQERFLAAAGLSRTLIHHLKRSGRLAASDPLRLYPTIRTSVDTVQLVFLLQLLRRRGHWSTAMALDALRAYVLMGHRKDVLATLEELAPEPPETPLQKACGRWLSDARQFMAPPLPLSSVSDRLFAAGGHHVAVNPSKVIRTGGTEVSLERFVAVRAIMGFWGVREVHLFDVHGRKMFFNRDASDQLRRILLYAPEIGEATILHFSGFFFTGVLKKFCSQLEIGEEKG